jgi:molybdopterin molybdotransferase
VLANGDELVEAGSDVRAGQVVNAIAPALLELLEQWGAAPIDLGVASDTIACVRARIEADVDLAVAIGGASVGDFDVVRQAFAQAGHEPVFEKVAVKPGKPTWFSARSDRLVVGLPGNPAAAMVTARLFLRPLLEAMTGAPDAPPAEARARTTKALPATEGREEYLRAVLAIGADGVARITPAEDQDSSLLSPFLRANALIRRPARSPACAAGELVDVVMLD